MLNDEDDRVRINVIRVGEEISGALQKKVALNILTSDIHILDNRHSGKYISNVMYDTHHIKNLVVFYLYSVNLSKYEIWVLKFF